MIECVRALQQRTVLWGPGALCSSLGMGPRPPQQQRPHARAAMYLKSTVHFPPKGPPRAQYTANDGSPYGADPQRALDTRGIPGQEPVFNLLGPP